MNRMMSSCGLACAFVFCVTVGGDAGEPTSLLTGADFRSFRPTEGWRFVDRVRAVTGKMEFQLQGRGPILVNGAQKGPVPYLYTKEEFQDVRIYLEFMVPQGSNAGVYLQGRYEIQIFDSYGVEQPKYSDLGGVYQRGNDLQAARSGFAGVPPRVNAAKPPGEWQSLEIVFRGPRFGEAGQKAENARFVRVEVNGRLVHENQEVTGPTRAAQFRDEKPRGPITIQGDHGPLALRAYTVERLQLDR